MTPTHLLAVGNAMLSAIGREPQRTLLMCLDVYRQELRKVGGVRLGSISQANLGPNQFQMAQWEFQAARACGVRSIVDDAMEKVLS